MADLGSNRNGLALAARSRDMNVVKLLRWSGQGGFDGCNVSDLRWHAGC